MSKIKLQCPVCGSIEEVEVMWLMSSEKLCCRSCNKAFLIEQFRQVKDENEKSDDFGTDIF